MKKKTDTTHLPLESLACVVPECHLYGQPGQGNLTVRKVYGKHDQIRFLRCCECQEEFSERKNTALWNCKIPEEKAVSVMEHPSEANSIKGTARLVRVDPSTVRRLNKRAGRHGEEAAHQELRLGFGVAAAFQRLRSLQGASSSASRAAISRVTLALRREGSRLMGSSHTWRSNWRTLASCRSLSLSR